MLYTKCILKPPSQEDGLRISVMSRHTLSDGKTPDLRVTDDLFHIHISILGPDPNKIGSYLRGEIVWEEFAKSYLQKLHSEPASTAMEILAKSAAADSVTILCIEKTPEKCHRRLLAEECKRRFPNLQIEHR